MFVVVVKGQLDPSTLYWGPSPNGGVRVVRMQSHFSPMSGFTRCVLLFSRNQLSPSHPGCPPAVTQVYEMLKPVLLEKDKAEKELMSQVGGLDKLVATTLCFACKPSAAEARAAAVFISRHSAGAVPAHLGHTWFEVNMALVAGKVCRGTCELLVLVMSRNLKP